ncbi:MAG: phosphoribosylanthranilate isomerase [Pseudomonadota bacterium]
MGPEDGHTAPLRVKICGLTDPVALRAAVEAGAAYVGFVHFAPSPRHLSTEAIAALGVDVPPGTLRVLLLVEPDDRLLEIAAGLPIDMIQLHGHETADRVTEAKRITGLPVMKAIGISEARDLDQIAVYAPVADQLLVDTKAPKGASRPGGNAVSFDWSLIAGRRWPLPWMLAGGLKPERIAEAVRVTGARQLDLSSAVESAPGVKDPAKIRSFLAAAAGAVAAEPGG